MAAKDAMSNAASSARVSAAERRRSEENHRKWEMQRIRQEAIELALKMCPSDVVRTAEGLLSDADKLTVFMVDGKLPKKARQVNASPPMPRSPAARGAGQ